MKLIIAGSRDFTNYSFLERHVLRFIKKHRKGKEHIEIISGQARGADKLGEKFADKYNLKKHLMPANWLVYGNSAGYIRNIEMASKASHVICFWDGKSLGTKHMIKTAKGHNLVYEVINLEKTNGNH